MLFKVLELQLHGGVSPYARWFVGLDPVVAAKVTTAKYRMQQGNLSKKGNTVAEQENTLCQKQEKGVTIWRLQKILKKQ